MFVARTSLQQRPPRYARDWLAQLGDAALRRRATRFHDLARALRSRRHHREADWAQARAVLYDREIAERLRRATGLAGSAR